MKFDKLRGPALAAAAVLLIGGAASVFAGSPTPATQAPDAANQVEQVEPAGTDADNLQQGDQTTPDVAGAGSAAEAASEAAKEATTDTGTEAGGHQDPAGQNVDHQFDGEE